MNTQKMKIIDAAGMTASALCAVHCLVTPFILTALPLVAARLLNNDAAHHGLVGFVAFFGLAGCFFGYQRHKSLPVLAILLLGLAIIIFGTFFVKDLLGAWWEAPIMCVGSALMIGGHLINSRIGKRATANCCDLPHSKEKIDQIRIEPEARQPADNPPVNPLTERGSAELS